jgi:hypothetical protein
MDVIQSFGLDSGTVQPLPNELITAVFGDGPFIIQVVPQDTIVIASEEGQVIQSLPNVDVITSPNAQGPPGPPGRDGSAVGVTAVSSIAISGHRVVLVPATDVQYASNDDPTHVNKVLGLTNNAAAAGDDIEVVTAGEVIEPSWNWTPGPVYLGLNGLLTQTVPTSGFIKQVGIAMTATRLLVAFWPPIMLN